MRPIKKAHRCDAGFTLIELLAAIALLSLVSLVLLRILNFGFKAWEGGASHANRIDHLTTVHDFLRRMIEDAYPYMSGGDLTRHHIDFDGRTDALDFLAATPRALGGGGRSRMVLSVIRHDGVADLALSSNLELAHEGTQKHQKVLVANAASIDIAYFGNRRTDRAMAWHPQWMGETSPPRLVRIRMRFPPGDTRSWPDLVVAPRIVADVGCTYDPLTKRCRGR